MSELIEFNLSEYLKGNVVYLDNLSLENCRLASPAGNGIVFRKCTFQNVIIDGNYESFGNGAVFYECEFRKCIFQGDFGETYLEWREDVFEDCLFENINIEYGGDLSSVANSGFFDCIFRNVKLNQDIHFQQLTISGGKMQNLILFSTHMIANLFSNVQMEQVKISAVYGENVMDSVIFKDVNLEWESEDHNYPDENMFYQCDTNGLNCYERLSKRSGI